MEPANIENEHIRDAGANFLNGSRGVKTFDEIEGAINADILQGLGDGGPRFPEVGLAILGEQSGE
jgi:hypothetical protein